MVLPSFLTPKYGILFGLMLLLCAVALHKIGDLPSSDVRMSAFGVELCIANGKLQLTKGPKELRQNLLSITSCTPTRFDMVILNKEVIHACPKLIVWVLIALGFCSVTAFNLKKKKRRVQCNYSPPIQK